MVCLFTPELQNLVEGDNNITFRSPKIDNFLSREVILCQKDTCSSWTIFCPALTKFCQVRLLLWQNIGTLRSKKDFRRGDMCWHMLASINSWKDFTHVHKPFQSKKACFPYIKWHIYPFKDFLFVTISALLLCVFVSFEWDLCCTTSNCRKSDNFLMYQAHSGTTFDFPWWQTSNTLPYFSLATYSVEIQFSTVSLFQLLYFEESSEILGFPALPHRPTVAPNLWRTAPRISRRSDLPAWLAVQRAIWGLFRPFETKRMILWHLEFFQYT